MNDSYMLTKSDLARFLKVSTRTIDRWRAMGVDVGAVRLPSGIYRFDRRRVEASIASGIVGKVQRKSR